MSKLSGLKDVDREILRKLDDIELLKACSIDKYTWNTVCDDAFLRRRLLAKYPEIEQYKKETESWKRFFLRAVYCISKLKEVYGYEYTFGNFSNQYIIFKRYKKDLNKLLFFSAHNGELSIVIWSLKNGANIHFNFDVALRYASEKGHLEVVKYLVENGANVNAKNNYALRYASEKGHLEVVKYLVEKGANIHAVSDYALRHAELNKKFEVVNYLKS